MDLVPFGKYKGQPVEVLQNDTQYCDWLMAQGWFRARYANVYQVIINNFGEPSETPEHNAMQAKWLDETLCVELLRALNWKPVSRPDLLTEKAKKEKINSINSKGWLYKGFIKDAQANLDNEDKNTDENIRAHYEKRLKDVTDYFQILNKEYKELEAYAAHIIVKIKDLKFEDCGWDVTFKASAIEKYLNIKDEIRIMLELKPSLGDDYPSILRQMKTNKERMGYYDCNICCCLIYDQFTANGATAEQVKKIFANADITVLNFMDVTEGVCTDTSTYGGDDDELPF